VNPFQYGPVVSRVFSVSVLALALLAGSALAQNADRPNVKVGDQWQFVMYYGISTVQLVEFHLQP